MGSIANKTTTTDPDAQYIQDVCDLVKLAFPTGTVHTDPVHVNGHLCIGVVDQTLIYRFGALDGRWGAEYRNSVCDPPDQYDSLDDGPDTSLGRADVAGWIVAVVKGENHLDDFGDDNDVDERNICGLCGTRYATPPNTACGSCA